METMSVKSNSQQVKTIVYLPCCILVVSFITIKTGHQLFTLECSQPSNNLLQIFPCLGEIAPVTLLKKKKRLLPYEANELNSTANLNHNGLDQQCPFPLN